MIRSIVLLAAFASVAGLSQSDRDAAALQSTGAPIDNVATIEECTSNLHCNSFGDTDAQCDTTTNECVCSTGFYGTACVPNGQVSLVVVLVFVFPLGDCSQLIPGTTAYLALITAISSTGVVFNTFQVFCGSAVVTVLLQTDAANTRAEVADVVTAVAQEAAVQVEATGHTGADPVTVSVQPATSQQVIATMAPGTTEAPLPAGATPSPVTDAVVEQCTSNAANSYTYNGNCLVLDCNEGYARNRIIVNGRDSYTCDAHDTPEPTTVSRDESEVSDMVVVVIVLCSIVFVALVASVAWFFCCRAPEKDKNAPCINEPFNPDEENKTPVNAPFARDDVNAPYAEDTVV